MKTQNMPCALVELENVKQAREIVLEMANFSFMMSGMPRPVGVCAAEVEMFDDRPRKPGRNIHCCWLDSNDPDFEGAKKLKHLTRKHAAEASFLHKQLLAEEEKLADKQGKPLKANYKKYDLIERVLVDGTVNRLTEHYNANNNLDA